MRRQISVVSLICTACMALSGGIWAQQSQIAVASVGIPEAPSAVRTIVPTTPKARATPKPSQWRLLNAETDHLTNREVFDKKFWLAHGIFLDSIIYDAELTHQGLAHHLCVEGNPNLGQHPSRGEIYRNNLLQQFLPITLMDWALSKYVWKGLGYEGATVGSVVHFRGGTKWLTSGCW